MKISCFIAFATLLIGCASPVVHVQVFDGDTRTPLSGVRILYWGYSPSILSRGPASDEKVFFGLTDIHGLAVVSNYPDRGFTELYFSKNGYALGHIQWQDGNEKKAHLVSPWDNEVSHVSGCGQGEFVNLSKLIILNLYRYNDEHARKSGMGDRTDPFRRG